MLPPHFSLEKILKLTVEKTKPIVVKIISNLKKIISNIF